ncbi:MAG: MFS transporter [Clostridia bacterium]|nr:MFS transporter [Clostridia bacterium]
MVIKLKSSYKRTKIACFGGYTVQAIINNFLPILFIIFRQEYGLSYESLGRIILVNFFVQIFADIATPFVAKKIGFKKLVVFCHFLAFLGLASFGFINFIVKDIYLSILISVVIYAFGSGIIEVVVSPIMEYLPTDNKEGNMSVLHSFYCWGQAFTIIVTTVLVKLLGFGLWKFIPIIWSAVPFINMIFFCTVPVVEPKKTEKREKGGKDLFVLILILALMLCSGASEIAMSQWASIFAQSGLKVSKVVGDILGPCAFAIFMGTGRILYAVFSKRIPFIKVMLVSSFLCAVCYFVVGISNSPIISLFFCAFCGITVSAFWPGTLSYAVKLFPDKPTFIFGTVALFGDLGCSLGPWLLGFAADKINLNFGFVISTVFPLLMIIIVLLLRKKELKN